MWNDPVVWQYVLATLNLLLGLGLLVFFIWLVWEIVKANAESDGAIREIEGPKEGEDDPWQ